MRPLHKVGEEGEKIEPNLVFDSYLLAGYPKTFPRGKTIMRTYNSGNSNVIDGYYTLKPNAFWHMALTPGRHIVGTPRRGRMKADSWRYSSEMHAAWGKVMKINGDTVTVEAPEIEGVAVSGVQTITIAKDAEFVSIGLDVKREDVLKVGSLIKVFNPHPARSYIGKK